MTQEMYDHAEAVVFFSVRADTLLRDDAMTIVRQVANLMAEPIDGAAIFVVRVGFREREGGFYWVMFNSRHVGDMFAALAQRYRPRMTRHLSLPNDEPGPVLQPVLPHLLETARHDPGYDAVEVEDEHVDGTAEAEAPAGLKARMAAATGRVRAFRNWRPGRRNRE